MKCWVLHRNLKTILKFFFKFFVDELSVKDTARETRYKSINCGLRNSQIVCGSKNYENLLSFYFLTLFLLRPLIGKNYDKNVIKYFL